MSQPTRNWADRRLPVVVAYLLLAVALVAAGLVLDRSLRQGSRRRAGAELDAVASLKVSAVVAWRDGKLGDAAYAAGYPVVEKVVRAAAAGRLDPELAAHATEVLAHLGALRGFARVALVGADARPLLEWRAEGQSDRPFDRPLLEWALRSGGAGATDLVDAPGADLPWLEAAVPVRLDGVPPAVLVARWDSAAFFEAVLASWPVPSETGGAGLMRVEGDHVRIVAPPRQLGGRASVEVPLSELDRVASRAARGQVGVLEGKDAQGVPMLAAVRPVPGTGWLVRTRA